MHSPAFTKIKAAVKARTPALAKAYRATRNLPGLRPTNPRKHLDAYVRETTGLIVQTGPFAGMRMLGSSSWGHGDDCPKLLGTYEQELHPVLARAAEGRYAAFVDVGCAEGYYAVGLARLDRGPVYAYDVDPAALKHCRRAAEVNGVAQRIIFGGFCDGAALQLLAQDHSHLLIISDCEGYEVKLFADPAVRAALVRSDLVVETHDAIVPECTERLRLLFAGTHDVELVRAGSRDPNAHDILAHLCDWDRWQAVNENRPHRMNWLWCRSRDG